MSHVIAILNEFLAARPDVPVVADTGDALFAAVDVRVNGIVAPRVLRDDGLRHSAALGRANREPDAGRSCSSATARFR